ncbi:hypothetical protein ECAZ01_04671 (plasmid) [Escherichia coli]|nr:hypothetical protein ECAZ01_04671 [Escherichia coli]
MRILLSVILFLFTAFQSANAGGIPDALAGILSTFNQEIQGKLFVFSMAIPLKYCRIKSLSGFAWQTLMHRRKNRLSGAGQQISLKLCSQDNQLPSLIRRQTATDALSVVCSRRTARMPAALWFSLVLHGYMNVTTRMSHYRLCNGKRRNKSVVYGLIQIRFHRGNGVLEIKGQRKCTLLLVCHIRLVTGCIRYTIYSIIQCSWFVSLPSGWQRVNFY